MACAKCGFYTPKDSGRAQLLEARENLQKMRAMIPLTEDEQAAVDDGSAALDRLLARLADTPHSGWPDTPADRAAGKRHQPAAHRRPPGPSAVDLTILIPQNDPADVAFDRAAVGQGEPVDDGGLVGADAPGEGVQMGQVVVSDGGDPAGRRSPWRRVIISANAVTWAAVAFSRALRV